MKTKHITLILIFILSAHSCKKVKLTDNDFDVVKIGEYKVKGSEFVETLNKLHSTNESLTQKEMLLLLLDNYISAGLLIESARKLNLDQSEEFKEKLSIYRNDLIIKHNKLLRVKENEINPIEDINKLNIQNLEYCIDFIRIPKTHKDLKNKMLDFFNEGADIGVISSNPEFENWNNKGLSFYSDVPVHSVCLTKKVLKKVGTMKENEIKLIKVPFAYYLIRKKQFISPSYHFIDNKSLIMNNTLMAECIENGDSAFDSYQLKNSIISNDVLLQQIDFSISPITNQEKNDTLIAIFFGQTISVNDITQFLRKLPFEVQSYFYNKSTRKKAIATLILSNYEPYESSEFQDNLYRRYYKKIIGNEIEKNLPIDTIEFLKKWVSSELNKSNTNMLLPVFIENAKMIADESAIKKATKNKQIQVDDWLTPKKFQWYDHLQLNFEAIEKLEMFEDDTLNDNKILAYSNNWELKVKDFKDELNKLTPETRIGIAENDLSKNMIRYLADQSIKVPENININTSLLSTINIIGNSFDLLNLIINENDLVGTLGKVSMTVHELRKSVEELPESDKSKIINLGTRKKTFNNILLDKFWLSLYTDKKVIENNKEFKSQMIDYQNYLLAETIYKKQINVSDVILNQYDINIKLQKAIIDLNKERLDDFLNSAASEFRIEVNINQIKANYGIDLGSSRYFTHIKNLN